MIEAARRLMLDGIAIAVAGTEDEAIALLAAHHKEQGGAPQATAVGNGGRVIETRCNSPRGKFGMPPISEAEHLVKVLDCLATRLAPTAADALIALARCVDDLDATGL